MSATARRRVIDQALCDRARRLAGYHELQDVATILHLHPAQISRIKKRGWRACATRARPAPADLAERQAELSWSKLKAHYGVSDPTLVRWLRTLPSARVNWRGYNLRDRGRRHADPS